MCLCPSCVGMDPELGTGKYGVSCGYLSAISEGRTRKANSGRLCKTRMRTPLRHLIFVHYRNLQRLRDDVNPLLISYIHIQYIHLNRNPGAFMTDIQTSDRSPNSEWEQ